MKLKMFMFDLSDFFPMARSLVIPPSKYLTEWANFLNSLVPLASSKEKFTEKIRECEPASS
jgi:hypothetical protein